MKFIFCGVILINIMKSYFDNVMNAPYFALTKTIYLKRNLIIVIALAAFSLLTGYLLSAISFVGKAGINLFYTQYRFLKTWWKGALLVFIVWIILFIIQSAINKRVSKATSNITNAIMLVIAVVGLYFSYADFRHSLAHPLVGRTLSSWRLFILGWLDGNIDSNIIKKTINRRNYYNKSL